MHKNAFKIILLIYFLYIKLNQKFPNRKSIYGLRSMKNNLKSIPKTYFFIVNEIIFIQKKYWYKYKIVLN